MRLDGHSVFMVYRRALAMLHLSHGQWAISSAGEHYIDIVGVTGSIPVSPTILHFSGVTAFCSMSAKAFAKRKADPLTKSAVAAGGSTKPC